MNTNIKTLGAHLLVVIAGIYIYNKWVRGRFGAV
jgi:hypothetical protein